MIIVHSNKLAEICGSSSLKLYLLFDKSGMNQEDHIQFCEKFEDEISLYLLDCKLCLTIKMQIGIFHLIDFQFLEYLLI